MSSTPNGTWASSACWLSMRWQKPWMVVMLARSKLSTAVRARWAQSTASALVARAAR